MKTIRTNKTILRCDSKKIEAIDYNVDVYY